MFQFYCTIIHTYIFLTLWESYSDKVYSIQHKAIKFVSDSRQIGGFLRVLRFPPPIKLTRNDIAEILFKVALNTINPTPNSWLIWKKVCMSVDSNDVIVWERVTSTIWQDILIDFHHSCLLCFMRVYGDPVIHMFCGCFNCPSPLLSFVLLIFY